MCWSKTASLNLAISGTLIAIYKIIKGYHFSNILITVFYTIMEVLQYTQYDTLDKCDTKNANLTKIGWILSWLNALVWNIWLYYNTKDFRHNINEHISNKTMVCFFCIFSSMVYYDFYCKPVIFCI